MCIRDSLGTVHIPILVELVDLMNVDYMKEVVSMFGRLRGDRENEWFC